ncbi:MAG: tetratricopeptide repeat protein [Flavipsychrobacter sp.]
MYKRVLLFLSVLILSVDCQAQYDFLLNRSYAERSKSVDSLLFATGGVQSLDSVTYFRMLDDVATMAKKAKDEELYWLTKISRIEYCIFHWIYTYEEGVDELQALLPSVSKYPQLVLNISFLSGIHYYHNDEFTGAFDYLLRYKYLLDEITYEEYPGKKFYNALLGDLYYAFEDYEQAQKNLLIAEKFKAPGARHSDNGLLNTLGLVMRNTGKYDSALYYFNRVLSLAIDENDPWIPISNGNIGIVYYMQGRYKEAKPLLKEDIDWALLERQYDNISNQLIRLADIYRRLGNDDSARYYSRIAHQYIHYGRDTYKHAVKLYSLLSELAIEDGDTRRALLYKDSIAIAKDSVSRKRDVLVMAKAQITAQDEANKIKVAQIVKEKELSIQRRNNLIIILSLATVIGLLLLTNQYYRRKKLKAEKDLADNKLISASHRLSIFTKNLQEKNLLIENFTEEIERLQALPCSNELPNTKENLAKLQNAIILTDEQWDEFRELFETVHRGFLNRLREKLPELTPAEIRFMVLSKLKLSNKEMANMLGIGLSGMRNYKYRLRRKLDMADDTDLEQLIDSI